MLMRSHGLVLALCGLLELSAMPSGSAAAAETVSLKSNSRPGNLTRVSARLEAEGSVLIQQESKEHPLKMRVSADLDYEERLLELGRTRMRSVRFYNQAQADIKIEEGGLRPVLRDDRRLIGVESAADSTTTLFSPRGPLTREELDLIDVPGNTLWLDALLPAVPVSKGDSWTHSEGVWAALLRLDAVNAADVESSLRAVEAKVAHVEFAGHVDGAVDGVATGIEVQGGFSFDMAAGQITALVLETKEKRKAGYVSPGLDVTAKLTLSISPLEQSSRLDDKVLAGLPLEASPAAELLSYDAPHGDYRFYADRRWQLLDEGDRLTVVRLVDQGQLLAQCNVATLERIDPAKRMSLDAFRTEVQKALGEGFKRFLDATAGATPAGYSVYRAVALGTVDEVEIQWNYYLLSDDQGRQVVLAFTLKRDLVEPFADQDKALVESLRFLSPDPKTAAQPTPAKTDK